MKRILFFLTWLIIIAGSFSHSIFAQNSVATAFEIKGEESEYYGGKLYITVNGKKRKIAEQANDVWLVSGGNEVVYSGRDGAGGFENEGQSLRIYDVKTRKTRKIMSEYGFVLGVTQTKLSNGQNALLVRMGDGGLGGSYFAVVDPKRGEVFFQQWAELNEIRGDKIKLSFFKEDDWEIINEKRDWNDESNKTAISTPTQVKPDKTEMYNLKEVLKNKVIYNKTNDEMAAEYKKKYRDVRIYLWRPNDTVPDKDYFLMAAAKTISAKNAFAPLRPTLELLFATADKSELSDGFDSAVFGMKLEGVVLKDGIATIKFSQPKEKRQMPQYAGKMFLEAVENTAKQFPTVKKVEVCEIGGATNAFVVEPQIPKCSN